MAKKAKRTAALKRDFGGKGTKDWYTLKTAKTGISKSEAQTVAKSWRAKGYAAVIDIVGAKDKYGVYVRKSKRKPAKKPASKKK